MRTFEKLNCGNLVNYKILLIREINPQYKSEYLKSQVMIIQIFKQVQICLMPEHAEHWLLYLLDAGAHQVHYILKGSTE